MDKATLNDFGEQIESILKQPMASWGGWGGLSLLCQAKEVEDDTSKWLVRDAHNQPYAVAICSSPISPQLIARNIEKAEQARQVLGPKYGQVVLEPLHVGEYNGLSFAVWSYCFPLSDKRWRRMIQRWQWRNRFLEWLLGATKATLFEGDAELISEKFHIPLEHMATNEQLSSDIRHSAKLAIERLERGLWKPRLVLAHNDLWEENFLLCSSARQNDFGFVAIDWAGSQTKGQAIYDLIRVAESLRVRPTKLRSELEAHCQILDCELRDSHSYLLASLGDLGLHLDHFPMKRYIELAERCFFNLRRIVGSHYE